MTVFYYFFFTDPAPTELYTLSLHDALPICDLDGQGAAGRARLGAGQGALRRPPPRALHAAHDRVGRRPAGRARRGRDRKSTRLNSSHPSISYAVFCLKKKKKNNT